MPCRPLVGEDGKVWGWICGPGAYSHLVRASCPWCCLGRATTVHATRLVHSGYCAPDMVCGRCGQYWSDDDDSSRRPSEDEREKHIAIIQTLKRAGVKVGPPPIPLDLTEAI